jgi:uncharacterized membrane protein
MLSNFEKARIFDEDYARISDPLEKERAKKHADYYYGLDLKESKQQFRERKPHYAFTRVFMVVFVSVVLLLIAVAEVIHLFPEIPLKTVGGTTVVLLFAVATVTFFARGKLSEAGFVGMAGLLQGKVVSKPPGKLKTAESEDNLE